jgi:hypothetical protein
MLRAILAKPLSAIRAAEQGLYGKGSSLKTMAEQPRKFIFLPATEFLRQQKPSPVSLSAAFP